MKPRQVAVWIILAALAGSPAVGQSRTAVVGGGYASPTPLFVAPGQVITLFVHGVGKALSGEVRAEQVPLPTSLAGLSVKLRQTLGPTMVAVPMFAVRSLDSSCVGPFVAECKPLTAITIQLPFELIPSDLAVGSPISNQAVLEVSEDGLIGEPVAIIPRSNNIHVVTSCDQNGSFDRTGCIPLVAHADGNLVSASNPAVAGETLVIYAYGLGATEPTVPAGEASPDPPAVATASLTLGFDFSPNAAPKRPLTQLSPAANPLGNPLPPPSVSFAGLSPGLVGLYQLHFEVPVAPAGLESCNAGIQSNITVSIAGHSSFDGAGICLAGGTPLGAAGSLSGGMPQAGEEQSAGPFVPNFIPFPLGVDLTNLGRPVPPESAGLPPEQTRGVLPNP